jgi:predicted HicB family RNase H-like nuclease
MHVHLSTNTRWFTPDVFWVDELKRKKGNMPPEEQEKKQQFSVYLPPELIREVKHTAVDHGMSLSAFIEQMLRTHLQKQQPPHSLKDEKGETSC